MCIKSYFANRVAVAVELAQRELGEDAVLLSTRLTEGEAREFGKYEVVFGINVRIPMMPISQSDLMPISSEASNAGLSQCELVIGIRQGFLRVGAA